MARSSSQRSRRSADVTPLHPGVRSDPPAQSRRRVNAGASTEERSAARSAPAGSRAPTRPTTPIVALAAMIDTTHVIAAMIERRRRARPHRRWCGTRRGTVPGSPFGARSAPRVRMTPLDSPFAMPKQQRDDREPRVGVGQVVREREHEMPAAEADEPGDRAPEPPEPVHDLPAHVEQREVDRRRDADHERGLLGGHADRHRPQRQDHGAARPDRREQRRRPSRCGRAPRDGRRSHGTRRATRHPLRASPAVQPAHRHDGCLAREPRRTEHPLGVGQQQQHDDDGEARRDEHPEHRLGRPGPRDDARRRRTGRPPSRHGTRPRGSTGPARAFAPARSS